MGMGTVKHIQMVTRDGGRTYHSHEVDRDGHQIGPSRLSIHDSETIPNGLSAIPERVSGFVASMATGLTISALDRTRGCNLLRCGGRMQIGLTFIDWRLHSGREQRVRELFAREGIAPVHDARAEREAILYYPLPDPAQRIASLCSEVLASGYGIADDEPLVFTLSRYP